MANTQTQLVYTIDGQYLEKSPNDLNFQVKLDLKTACEPRYAELSIQSNEVKKIESTEIKQNKEIESFSNTMCKQGQKTDSFMLNNQINYVCKF